MTRPLLCLLLACSAAPLAAQTPCSVTLAFPSGSIALAAERCLVSFRCHPGGCDTYIRSLFEPVTVTDGGENIIAVGPITADDDGVEIFSADGAVLVARWRGQFVAFNYAVLAVDSVFEGGSFEP